MCFSIHRMDECVPNTCCRRANKRRKKWIENVFEFHFFFLVCVSFLSMFEQVRVVGPYKYQPVRLTVETVDRVEPERWLFLRIESSNSIRHEIVVVGGGGGGTVREFSQKYQIRHSSRIRLALEIFGECARCHMKIS